MYKIEMFCPSCRLPLKRGDDLRIQTTSEHVSNPNGTPSLKPVFYCSNKKCEAFHPHFSKKMLLEKIGDVKTNEDSNVFWSEDGEIYGNFSKKIKFIEDNDSPFGSISRRLHIEIYKKDENFTLLNLGLIKLVVVFKYKSDEDGNILKRTFKIETWLKNDIGYKLYMSPIRMFLFSINNFRRKYKYYKNNPGNVYAQKEVLREFEKTPSWNKSYYRILFNKYINLFYGKTHRKLILFAQQKNIGLQ